MLFWVLDLSNGWIYVYWHGVHGVHSQACCFLPTTRFQIIKSTWSILNKVQPPVHSPTRVQGAKFPKQWQFALSTSRESHWRFKVCISWITQTRSMCIDALDYCTSFVGSSRASILGWPEHATLLCLQARLNARFYLTVWWSWDLYFKVSCEIHNEVCDCWFFRIGHESIWCRDRLDSGESTGRSPKAIRRARTVSPKYNNKNLMSVTCSSNNEVGVFIHVSVNVSFFMTKIYKVLIISRSCDKNSPETSKLDARFFYVFWFA